MRFKKHIDEVIKPSQEYALVVKGEVVAKGSKKKMNQMRKKQGGRVWLSHQAKVGWLEKGGSLVPPK